MLDCDPLYIYIYSMCWDETRSLYFHVLVLHQEQTSRYPLCLRQIAWALANVAFTDESEESDLYCLSVVQAALYHPSEVPEWTCESGAKSPHIMVSRMSATV